MIHKVWKHKPSKLHRVWKLFTASASCVCWLMQRSHYLTFPNSIETKDLMPNMPRLPKGKITFASYARVEVDGTAPIYWFISLVPTYFLGDLCHAFLSYSKKCKKTPLKKNTVESPCHFSDHHQHVQRVTIPMALCTALSGRSPCHPNPELKIAVLPPSSPDLTRSPLRLPGNSCCLIEVYGEEKCRTCLYFMSKIVIQSLNNRVRSVLRVLEVVLHKAYIEYTFTCK